MPRIRDSAGNPLDFCNRCFPGKNAAARCYANPSKTGPEPVSLFGYNSSHPPYEEADFACNKCGNALNENDNEPRKRG